MRKSVVFVLVLAVMSFLGTSNAGAGIAGIFTDLDIRPQSCPNPLNVNVRGVLPVAILGTADFDVTMIDPASIRLAGVAPLRWSLMDVATPFNGVENTGCFSCTEDGPDGYLDMTLKFNAQEVIAAISDSFASSICLPLEVTGELLDGTPFFGLDYVLLLMR